MLPVLVILLLLIIIFVPQLWVQRVFNRYSQTIEDLSGTGGELAQHLINQFKLDGVAVESTENGNDHYDPDSKKIRLSEQHFNGKSLTAVTIAAHEFGHALQHNMHYKPLLLRTRLAKISAIAEKIASYILVSLPFTIILTRLPLFNLILLSCGLAIMCLPILLNLVTLPVEFDASFNRALPILSEGKYLPLAAIPVVKQILFAAAMTYVAASLGSLLNFYRWIAILRR